MTATWVAGNKEGDGNGDNVGDGNRNNVGDDDDEDHDDEDGSDNDKDYDDDNHGWRATKRAMAMATTLVLECLTAACKALSLANAKGKGTNGLVIRSLDD